MITFTRRRKGGTAYNPVTDRRSAPDVTTITGTAIKDTGDPDQYRELGLIQGQALTLLFTPTTYGDRIDVGDECEFPEGSGARYTARACEHLDPDGFGPIVTTVVVSR